MVRHLLFVVKCAYKTTVTTANGVSVTPSVVFVTNYFPLRMLHQQSIHDRRFVLTAIRPRFWEESNVVAGTSWPEGEPLLCGGGEDTILCGGCNFVLAVAVNFRELASELYLHCPHCGCDNELG